MNPWMEICNPVTGKKPDTPLQGIGFFLSGLSSFGVKIDVDKMTTPAWVAAVGRYDPVLVGKAVQSFARDPDRVKFTPVLPWVITWLASAAPPPPQCPNHVGQRAGFCGECRAERLVAGTEKMIGSSTVPPRRDSTPMPDYLRKTIEATKRP